MKKLVIAFNAFFSCSILANANLPPDFVYLKQIDPSIKQDIRYAGEHNFIGRPIDGYQSAECILTKQAAEALHQVQLQLKPMGYSLKVYDCYRPQRAVNDFIQWSKLPQQQQMKAEFYPRVDKKDFFKLGYVAMKSGHTRGSTVDLTLVPAGSYETSTYTPGVLLEACYAPYEERFNDGSIDMGTGFDCLDPAAWPSNDKINEKAYKNRQILQEVMKKNGFVPYDKEWWHFTLKNEPFPNRYFNFPVK